MIRLRARKSEGDAGAGKKRSIDVASTKRTDARDRGRLESGTNIRSFNLSYLKTRLVDVRTEVKSVSRLRFEKDMQELAFKRNQSDFASCMISVHDNITAPLSIDVNVSLRKGPYRGGSFDFNIAIGDGYPYEAPVVFCLTRAYHPNICFQTGKVHIALISKDWRPVLSINSVVLALQLMFLEPQKSCAVNEECCRLYAKSQLQSASASEFEITTQRILRGCILHGYQMINHFASASSFGNGSRVMKGKRSRPSAASFVGEHDRQSKRPKEVKFITKKLSKTHVSGSRERQSKKRPGMVVSPRKNPSSVATSYLTRTRKKSRLDEAMDLDDGEGEI